MDGEGPGSVTHWIAALRAGDLAAARPLWERYFRQLVHLARARFSVLRKAGAIEDEEDTALSAFKSVCMGLVDGRHPGLSDRDELWRLLVVIAGRKAINQAERWGRQKRGGGRLVRESDLGPAGNDQDEASGLDQLVGPDPTPELIAIMAEEHQRLMAALDHPELRLSEVAAWRMQGLTRDEIALKLDCSRRTVASRLELIRKTWEQFL